MDTSTQIPTTFKIIGDWKAITRSLRERFPLLTDDDLFFESGKEEELVGRLQDTLNRRPEEIMNLINRFQVKFFVSEYR